MDLGGLYVSGIFLFSFFFFFSLLPGESKKETLEWLVERAYSPNRRRTPAKGIS